MFSFLRNCQLPQEWLYHLIFPPAMCEGSSFPTPWPTFGVTIFYFSHFNGYVVIAHSGFNLYIPNDVEYLFMYLFAICLSLH